MKHLPDNCCDTGSSCCSEEQAQIAPHPCSSTGKTPSDEPCCGPPPAPPSSDLERPGYKILNCVKSFKTTPAGRTPQVSTTMAKDDILGSIAVRLGINRNNYTIAPGLYCVGDPDEHAPVLVTANYKLTFDTLRKELSGMDLWILVLDTRGINVWCAAGKNLFSTPELIRQITGARLHDIVSHRQCIVPQLGATGVQANEVKKATGFKVIWGPVRASDLKAFIQSGYKAEKSMRLVTFTLLERIILIPVEFSLWKKTIPWIVLLAFVFSGINSQVFSFSQALEKGLIGLSGFVAGTIAGSILVPVFLPRLPFRSFSLKGGLLGLGCGLIAAGFSFSSLNWLNIFGLILFTITIASFQAMHFTGSTPYTSPSGVEKEMRTFMPMQAVTLLVATALWVGGNFIPS